MKRLGIWLCAASFALVSGSTLDAHACGSMWVTVEGASDTIEASGHQMVLSVSPTQTTLWDQIVYTGAPEEFAWVLPIKGSVEVGVSSDLLFQELAKATEVRIGSYTSCFYNCGYTSTGGSSNVDGSTSTPVTVLAHDVVGPYETVQISSQDPNALQAWLASHGYVVPGAAEPVIADYVAEGFDFLAVRLVPGAGVDAMQPIRVTSPGASLTLPLRMVAVGAANPAELQLWVVGEGRYDPTNFPATEISANAVQVVGGADNYAALLDSALVNGDRWIVQAAEPLAYPSVATSLDARVDASPAGSGYGDSSMEAKIALEADLEDLVGGIPLDQLWITRLYTRMKPEAMAQDLILGAAGNTPVQREFLAEDKSSPCPPPPCSPSSSSSSGGWNDESDESDAASPSRSSDSGGCAWRTRASPAGSSAFWLASLVVLATAAAAVRFRRSPRR